jgi:hypothetical protein
MISKSNVFAAVLAGALICSAAGAQVRERAPSIQQPAAIHAALRASRPAGAPPASAAGNGSSGARSVHAPGALRGSSNGRRLNRFVPPANSAGFDNTNDSPGLGFDFPHLAAIARAQGRSTHLGHNEHGGQGSFIPFFYGGYPYYADDLEQDQAAPPAPEAPEQQAQPQPQISVMQQPSSSHEGAASENETGNLAAGAPAASAEAAVPDIGNFVLVRRDGRIVFASLFSVVGTQLQYITPEGIRRTMALTDLDSDATEQMNEARGTTVQIRN